MKCKRIQELIGAYIYGDLSPDEMREVRVHARECAGCREDLESRGRVLTQLPNTPPTLSDEDRQRVAWSVKGAVRNQELSRRPLLVRFAPVFAAAIVLTVGVALGALYVYQTELRSPATQLAKQKKSRGHPAAVVEVTEDRGLPAAKNNTKTALNSGDKSAAKEPNKPDMATIAAAAAKAAAEVFHSGGAGVATASRGNTHKRKAILPEAPVTVVSPDAERQPKDESGSVKLPEPTDVNDARTTPPKKNE